MKTSAKRAFSALATVSVLIITVFGIVALTAVPVSAENRVVLSGPTTGHPGETLTYSALVSDCPSPDACAPIPGISATFRFVNPDGSSAAMIVTTNSQGLASRSFTPSQTGTYQISVSAGGVTSNTLQVTITAEATPTPEAAPTQVAGDGGQQPPAGDAVATTTPSTSAAGMANIASQAEAAAGRGSSALLIVFGLAIVILLAVIAAVLLKRRRGDDEYEREEPYKRERRYRR
jgi:hypothetical protein